MKANLKTGDRVAFSAKFLRSIGQQAGEAGHRRGTLLRFDESLGRVTGKPYARVRWDVAPDYEYLAQQYGDDYAEQVKEQGELVLALNLCRVGGAGFSAD